MDNNYFSALTVNDISNISNNIFNLIKGKRNILIVCIGTDSCIGDSLGPLTGTLLKKSNCPYLVLGDLENVISSNNLRSLYDQICQNYKDYFIIAIDACLGYKSDVGKVIIERGSIQPASAINNNYMFIGDVCIKAVVNSYSPMKYANIHILQNTRLFQIYSMADILNHSLNKALNENLKYLKAK